MKQPLYIVTDTREQKPFLFDRFPLVTTCKGTLPAGDYSLRAMESFVALERKALDDLISCLCHVRIPDQSDHGFRSKVTTDSD